MHKEDVPQLKGASSEDPGLPSRRATPSPWSWEPIWAQSVVSLIMFQIVWGGLLGVL